MALLLFAGSLVNYVDRAVLGVLMPELRRDLGLTATGYAMAVNAFLVAYTVFYVAGRPHCGHRRWPGRASTGTKTSPS